MRGWLRVALVIFGIALVTTAGAYVLGQYAPSGFSSYLAQSLSIAILSLGIASSTIAVLSGRGIEEYFKRRNEEKIVKSALVSYLAGLPLQISPITSLYYGISKMDKFPKLPAQYPPFVDTDLQSQIETQIRVPTIDTSYYEKNIKDRLLYLPEQLARDAISIALVVATLNKYYSVLAQNTSSKTMIAKGVSTPARILTTYLDTHLKSHRLISEFGNEATKLIQNLTIDLLGNKESKLNFKPLLEMMQMIASTYETEGQSFIDAIFPAKTPVSSSSTDKPPQA